MKIPFVDLQAQYQLIKEEIDSAVSRVIAETAFVRGKYVSEFENEFAKVYGVEHCISCGNGTDALYITLKALGIGPGDEVITTAMSWISTSQTISQTGAKVVFVDVDQNFFTLDPLRIEEKITEKTRAIVPVHLYGQAADMERIMAIANSKGLFVIEDCAQAHFATFRDKKVGTFGVAGAFSFYPGKNLGAYGDAGAIVSCDEKFSVRARMFANHGSLVKHQHEIEGINSRLDGLQAAILSVKLHYIEKWNEQRRDLGKLYDQLLTGINGVLLPKVREGSEHVYHLYVIQVDSRDELSKYLRNEGIETGIHYPVALPYLNAYRYLHHGPEEFPLAYTYQSKILSLPMYPELTFDMVDFVAQAIRQYYR